MGRRLYSDEERKRRRKIAYDRDAEKIRAKARKFHHENKVRLAAKRRIYDADPVNKVKRRAYLQANKDRIRAQVQAHNRALKEKDIELFKKTRRQYYRNNVISGTYRKAQLRWKLENPDYVRNYQRTRLANDPNARTKNILRVRIRTALKRRGKCKSHRTCELIGCDVDFLRDYLEARFSPGMSWENHGKHGWHIDHKIPCAKFDLTDPAQQKQCFHYSNLQPLWAADNWSKHDTLPEIHQAELV